RGARVAAGTCRGDAIATNPDGTVKIGNVTIQYGLRLVLAGQWTFAGLVTLDGRFVLTLTPPPAEFSIAIEFTGTLKLIGIGTIGSVHGGLILDKYGLVASIDVAINGDFGKAIGLQFSANGTFRLNTGSFARSAYVGGPL